MAKYNGIFRLDNEFIILISAPIILIVLIDMLNLLKAVLNLDIYNIWIIRLVKEHLHEIQNPTSFIVGTV